MEKTAIVEYLKRITTDTIGVDEDLINTNSNFVDDLGADSLDQMEMLMNAEDYYNIEIPDEHAEKIKTFGDAVEYINDNL